MGSREETIKSILANKQRAFSEDELFCIIEQQFFSETPEIDMELVDMALHQIAIIRGISEEEECAFMANHLLKKYLGIE